MKIKFLQNLLFIGMGVILYLSTTSYSNTSGGQMKSNSISGCSCHGSASASTSILLSGFPTSTNGYTLGHTYHITATVANSTAAAAGINLSVTTGTINNLGSNLATLNTKSIYHSSPKAMAAGVTNFTFDWVAPSTGTALLNVFVSANAVNLSGNTNGDAWNSNTSSVPLFLDYLTFNVKPMANQVKLNWQTTEEKDIKYFILERSEDGFNFDSINVVIANGAPGFGRTYDIADYPAYTNEYYYRLKIVSHSGDETYSLVRKINFDNGAKLEGFSFPNPSANSEIININIFNNKSKTFTINIFNIDGVLVYQSKYLAIKGTNYIRIANQLASGLYQIQVQPEVGKAIIFKHSIN